MGSRYPISPSILSTKHLLPIFFVILQSGCANEKHIITQIAILVRNFHDLSTQYSSQTFQLNRAIYQPIEPHRAISNLVQTWNVARSKYVLTISEKLYKTETNQPPPPKTEPSCFTGFRTCKEYEWLGFDNWNLLLFVELLPTCISNTWLEK